MWSCFGSSCRCFCYFFVLFIIVFAGFAIGAVAIAIGDTVEVGRWTTVRFGGIEIWFLG